MDKKRGKKKLIKAVWRGLAGEEIRSEEYVRYLICKDMHWDYYTYESQPAFFIEEVLTIMNLEGQKSKKDARDLERKSKSMSRRKR